MTKKKVKTNDKAENTTEKYQFGAETSKILQLVIHSLYAHKEVFLRELISNSSDALDKLNYLSLTKPELTEDDSEFKINILIDKKNNTLSICDNGVGMNKKELIDNLGTIASSGTQKFLNAQTENKDLSQLIGQFGVGFYSAFMAAKKIEVTTTKAGQKKSFLWRSTGDGNYEIEEAKSKLKRGTIVKLFLKDNELEFLDKHRIRHVIKTYSDHISYPIEYSEDDSAPETINKGSALWRKPKSEITEEQYNEFYRHIAHAPDKPWMVFHNKAEGNLEYTSLLFIPTNPPYDLYHPDRMTRVKLYIKRVFIAEQNIDIVPKYFRFLRGIVDSEDLPLNISRETLQHNHTVHKINHNLVKKILGELKKKAANEKEDFAKFWTNFGATLKEGLCENIDANRDLVLEVCHFRSSKHPDRWITLDEYISEMEPGQDKIYYALGDTLKLLMESPQLEGFIKKNINVILLTDHVDDFWVNTVHQYKDKDFISVTRAGLDLADNDNEQKTEITDETQKLINFIKETLKGKVLDVKVSKKLTSSPVCLTVQEGGMDMRMERFLLSQKQLASPSLKILEINPEHNILKYLINNLGENDAKELAELLFDQACIIEGENIYDTLAFSNRFNNFVERALK